MKAFTSIPFFRILIPLISGILVALKIELPEITLFYVFALLVPLVFLHFYKPQALIFKWTFIISADVFLFLLGANLTQQKDLSRQAIYYGNKINPDSAVTFVASINDVPSGKERFIKCELKLLEIETDKGFKPTRGTVLGYFKRTSVNETLRAGQTVLVKTSLMRVASPKNPFEFNYQNYLYNKQIYHTCFIDSTSYVIVRVANQLNPLWKLGLRCKEFVLTRLKNSTLSKNAYGICAALLTGYDDEIDKPVMEAFSHSGTLHVLSVSGLHTGLIYLAFNFLFNFFDKKRKYKLQRFVLITFFLWFFALITGFSAPVLRAVIMLNLIGLGKIFFRSGYKHQLNILSVSAFILLVYNPFYLLDIGFLLSYFAMCGLIYFQPWFYSFLQPKSKIADYVWQSITASLAATISTLPITLFCFKQFPLWFFVCNIVVVPATFLLLLLTLFVVFKLNIITLVINYVVSILIWFINLFNSKGFGFIDNIHFTFLDLFFLALLIILFSMAFQYRSYKQLLVSILLLIIWQFNSLINSYSTKKESCLTVYNSKNNSAISVKNKTKVTLVNPNPAIYNFTIKPHFNSFNYADIENTKFNIVKSSRQLILILNSTGFWPEIDLSKVTTLILANNFKLKAADLEKMGNLKMLVADASNNNYTLANLEELSRNFSIQFCNTKHKGAYLLAL